MELYNIKMKKHVSEIKAMHLDKRTKLIRNSKVYFKNFDLLKRKQFFSSRALTEPLYNFNLCDTYINQNTILLIGKMNVLGRIHEINITVFEKDRIRSKDTTFKELKRTNSHLEIEFKDSRFDKNIIAMIRIGHQDDIEEYIENWI